MKLIGYFRNILNHASIFQNPIKNVSNSEMDNVKDGVAFSKRTSSSNKIPRAKNKSSRSVIKNESLTSSKGKKKVEYGNDFKDTVSSKNMKKVPTANSELKEPLSTVIKQQTYKTKPLDKAEKIGIKEVNKNEDISALETEDCAMFSLMFSDFSVTKEALQSENGVSVFKSIDVTNLSQTDFSMEIPSSSEMASSSEDISSCDLLTENNTKSVSAFSNDIIGVPSQMSSKVLKLETDSESGMMIKRIDKEREANLDFYAGRNDKDGKHKFSENEKVKEYANEIKEADEEKINKIIKDKELKSDEPNKFNNLNRKEAIENDIKMKTGGKFDDINTEERKNKIIKEDNDKNVKYKNNKENKVDGKDSGKNSEDIIKMKINGHFDDDTNVIKNDDKMKDNKENEEFNMEKRVENLEGIKIVETEQLTDKYIIKYSKNEKATNVERSLEDKGTQKEDFSKSENSLYSKFDINTKRSEQLKPLNEKASQKYQQSVSDKSSTRSNSVEISSKESNSVTQETLSTSGTTPSSKTENNDNAVSSTIELSQKDKATQRGSQSSSVSSENSKSTSLQRSENSPLIKSTTSENFPMIKSTTNENFPIIKSTTSENFPMIKSTTSEKGDDGKLLKISARNSNSIKIPYGEKKSSDIILNDNFDIHYKDLSVLSLGEMAKLRNVNIGLHCQMCDSLFDKCCNCGSLMNVDRLPIITRKMDRPLPLGLCHSTPRKYRLKKGRPATNCKPKVPWKYKNICTHNQETKKKEYQPSRIIKHHRKRSPFIRGAKASKLTPRTTRKCDFSWECIPLSPSSSSWSEYSSISYQCLVGDDFCRCSSRNEMVYLDK